MVAKSSRHLPQRTCIACRKAGEKRGLIRLVRAADGRILVDAGGKLAGRGAYLCRDCLAAGVGGKNLEYALRTRLTEAVKEEIIRAARESLPAA